MNPLRAHTIHTAFRTAMLGNAVELAQIVAFTVCMVAWVLAGLLSGRLPPGWLNSPQKALTALLIGAGIAWYRRTTGAFAVGGTLAAQLLPQEFARMGAPRPGGAIDSLVIEQAINTRLRSLRNRLEALQREGRVTCTPTLGYSPALSQNAATLMDGNGQTFIVFAYDLLYGPGTATPAQLEALLHHELGHAQCGHVTARQAAQSLTRHIRAALFPFLVLDRFSQKGALRLKQIASLRWSFGLVLQLVRLVLNLPLLPLRIAEAFERSFLLQAEAEADAWAVTMQESAIPLLEAALDLARRDIAATEKASAEPAPPGPGFLARLKGLLALEEPGELLGRAVAHRSCPGGRGHPGTLPAFLCLASADLMSHPPLFRRCDELARLESRLREEAS